jgi:DNA-binding MarR family transcriptional regulator
MADDLVMKYRLLIADVYELAGRSRATSEAYARKHGQTAARWHVLSVVSEEPFTVPQIAERLGLTRQSVQRVVDDLAAEGLVELVPNERHRRSPLVAITEVGSGVTRRLYADSARDRRRSVRRAGISAADLDQARATIRALVRALDDIGSG